MTLGYLSLQSSPVRSQELCAAIVDARRHAEAVEFYLMQPLRSGRSLLDRLAKLRRDEARKRRSTVASARRTGRDGLR